jgi:FAD/FMN-containing dehydrogenase
MSPASDLIAKFAAIVGAENALTDPDAQAPHLREWRDRYVGRTPVVLRPGSTSEVSQILALANATRTAIVPQGGNTGLVGGQIPNAEGTEVVLSVSRMKRVREIDPAGTHMIVEAGLTVGEAQAVAAESGRMFPLSLASEGSCQIGGVLATNAGGINVLSYGSARDLALGLEVVLPDGRIWNGLRTLKKDNTGYDLRDLFIGSEGTLSVITAAVLKLFPAPRDRTVALAGLPDIDTVLSFFQLAETTLGRARLTAFEFMSARALEFVTAHIPGARSPFAAAHPWLALIEISSTEPNSNGRDVVERLLADAAAQGIVTDAVVAGSLSQAQSLWRLREAMSESQKPEGGSIKHDISVPIARIPEFIKRGEAVVASVCPGARPVPFGHFGDGNIHYNVSQPVGADREAYLALWPEMTAAVHGLVLELGGSISAEHGIGRMKREELAKIKGGVEIDLMRAIKAAFDPNGILNPGKVV